MKTSSGLKTVLSELNEFTVAQYKIIYAAVYNTCLLKNSKRANKLKMELINDHKQCIATIVCQIPKVIL